MAIAYVTEQGAVVGLKRARLEIRKRGQVLESVRLDQLEQLVLYGKVQVTAGALHALLARSVDTVLLNRGGAFLGRLTTGLARNIELRHRQFARSGDPEFLLRTARAVVAGKLHNQRALLQRYQRTRPDDQRIPRGLVAIRLGLEALPAADTLDRVRGIEGAAAAAYFAAFPALIAAEGVTFEKRLRRPPPDPVNILLSFGYTLLGNLVHGLVEQAGLDPYLGALHAMSYGRPSLALDLIEEWRPAVVDRAVLAAVNTRAVRPTDFVSPDSDDPQPLPVEDAWSREDAQEQDAQSRDDRAAPLPRRLLLTTEGSKKWFQAYENRLAATTYYPPQDRRLTYRQIIREQVYRYCRHIDGKEPYRSFEVPYWR